MPKAWYQISLSQLFRLLKAETHGLSSKEAWYRVQRYGQNVLPEKERFTRLSIFLSQWKSILILILLGASLLSFLLGEYIDGGVIFFTILVNVFIGYYQEKKAQDSLAQLKHVIAEKAVALRDGHEKIIGVSEIVPGDILLLSAGTKIPADGRVISGTNLQVNEASLTGESLPTDKSRSVVSGDNVPLAEQENMVFAGTLVVSGLGRMIVCATGIKTEIGHIAQLLSSTKEELTPLQKQLHAFSRRFGQAILVILVIFISAGSLLGREVTELFFLATALAVAAIPEGLLLAVTVTLALGMQNVLKRKGLVRRLASAETLGSTSVICSDKTGTLTLGDMKIVSLLTANHHFHLDSSKSNLQDADVSLALKIGFLSNDVIVENRNAPREEWQLVGSPTGKALFLGGMSAGLSRDLLLEQEPLLDIFPFSSEKKMRAGLHSYTNATNIIYVAGAPERLFPACTHSMESGERKTLGSEVREAIFMSLEHLAAQGLRVIMVAFKEVPASNRHFPRIKERETWLRGFTFVAFLALRDVLRPGVKEAISEARKAGIHPVMITGDNHLTAESIAKELGFSGSKDALLDGPVLSSLSDIALQKKIESIEVFSRVSPKDKLRIVHAWQAKGEIVAMTGDGINDAPALKAADIGIAVGDGTDVARETADLILLDNSFQTILDAVSEGRIIFHNIRKIILYLLSGSFTEILLIGGAVLAGLPLPISASQILWINLLQDSFPAFALAFDRGERGHMGERPRRRTQGIFDQQMKMFILIIALVNNAFLLALYGMLLRLNFPLAQIQSMMFASLGIYSLFFAFACRSFRFPLWHSSRKPNRYVLIAIFGGMFVVAASIFLPPLQYFLRTVSIPPLWFLFIIVSGFGQLLIIEGLKWGYNRIRVNSR